MLPYKKGEVGDHVILRCVTERGRLLKVPYAMK